MCNFRKGGRKSTRQKRLYSSVLRKINPNKLLITALTAESPLKYGKSIFSEQMCVVYKFIVIILKCSPYLILIKFEVIFLLKRYLNSRDVN